MNKNYYTIEEMQQLITEWHVMSKKIEDYKKSENVDDLTEEEFIYLFWESTLYPNIYYPPLYRGKVSQYISDYDQHLLDIGYDPFTAEMIDPICPEYSMNSIDYLNPADFAQDLCLTTKKLTFEQALEQISFLEREYLIMDEYYNITGSGLFDLGDNIDDYFRMLDQDYEFMKVEEPEYISQVEIECSLEEQIDFFNLYQVEKTKTMTLKLIRKNEKYGKEFNETVKRIKVLEKQNIVAEYEEQNNIKRITDEEITNIFGESELFPAYMYDNTKAGFDYWEITDYQFLMLLKEERRHNYIEYIRQIEQSYDLGEAESLSEGEYYFELNSELETKIPSNIKPPEDLNPEIISRVIEKSKLKDLDDSVELPLEQTLSIMLNITFFFKQVVERKDNPYEAFCRAMNEADIDKIGIMESKAKSFTDYLWIEQIPDLLLQTLYSLNGSYYRINDRNYDWEDIFLDTFLYMPYGEEFNRAMINILLWPLYKATHKLEMPSYLNQ